MKQFLIAFFMIIPMVLFSQDNSSGDKIDVKKRAIVAVSSDLFKINHLCFNKFQYELSGEYLETVFQIENLSNTPLELYVFVVATYESEFIPKSSFVSPHLEDMVLIKNIQTYPEDLTNFEYIEKDEAGVDQKVYYKYPKNVKTGIDPVTNKPYFVENTIIFRAKHFNKFVKNYYFFNNITILIYDADDDKLLFSQNYMVRPIRRR